MNVDRVCGGALRHDPVHWLVLSAAEQGFATILRKACEAPRVCSLLHSRI